jgi:hypothetical protein
LHCSRRVTIEFESGKSLRNRELELQVMEKWEKTTRNIELEVMAEFDYL